MLILGIDCSAKTASCALVEDGVILAESFVNAGLTHSETLMPMVQNTLATAKRQLGDINLAAITHGPGSFTGLRIGAAAVMGLCAGSDMDCVGISTLEATAMNLRHLKGYIVPCMDARRNQVYTAAFVSDGETLTRISEDSALPAQEALAPCCDENSPVFLLGDGGGLCYTVYSQNARVKLAPAHLLHTRGSAVAQAAMLPHNKGRTGAGDALRIEYIRLSQAQRMRQEKLRTEDTQ